MFTLSGKVSSNDLKQLIDLPLKNKRITCLDFTMLTEEDYPHLTQFFFDNEKLSYSNSRLMSPSKQKLIFSKEPNFTIPDSIKKI